MKGAVLPKNRNTFVPVKRSEDLQGPLSAQPVEDLLALPVPSSEEPQRNPLRPDGFPGKIFDFLASLRLGVVLLSVLGLVCIAGTIAESNYTARLAQRLVYRSLWFDFLLLAVFINVIFATLARFPWRITQLGFLVTHLGILITLAGMVVSHHYGVEGQMMLEEGQSKDSIRLDSTFIGIQKEGDPIRHRFNAVEVEWGKPTPSKPQVYDFPELGLKATVTGFYPDSEWREVWREGGPVDNPAAHFTIENPGMGRMAEGWLAPNIPSNRSVRLGPVSIVARLVPDQVALQKELANTPIMESTAELGILEISEKASATTVRIDVAQARKAPVLIGGTPYSIQVTEQMESGVIGESGVLENAPGNPPNPVVIYDVFKDGNRILTRQIEYALFPDFGMMHDQGVESPLEATYRYKGSSKTSGREFSLLFGPGERLTWKSTTNGQVTSGPVIQGQPVPLPAMTENLNLVIAQQLSRAWRDEELVEKPVKKGEFGSQAARLELETRQGEKQQVWAEMFNENEVTLGGQKYHIVYQNDQAPLGFSIQLKDFRLLHYPGGEARPMSYESDVKVTSQVEGESLTRDNITIMMNKPLDHGGYRIFQSSYIDQPRGDPRISIFSVAHDPGISILYVGSIILCLGIALMFYGKPYLKKLDQKWQSRKTEVPTV